MISRSIQRKHGLGNVVQLLRQLVVEARDGRAVKLVTRPEWAPTLQALAPEVLVVTHADADTIDLDAATEQLPPTMHRQDEFAHLLGLERKEPARLAVPHSWAAPWAGLRNHVAFSPEAEHESRRCPEHIAVNIAQSIVQFSPTVLVGSRPLPALTATRDLRGATTLQDLFGILANVESVVCMDSGTLHLAISIGVPTVALFGGIDPSFRVGPSDHCIVLLGDVACRPCNKKETCAGRFDCLQRHTGTAVVDSLKNLRHRDSRLLQLV